MSALRPRGLSRGWLLPRLLLLLAATAVLLSAYTDAPWLIGRALRPLLTPAPVAAEFAPFDPDLRGAAAAVVAPAGDGLPAYSAPDLAAESTATVADGARVDVLHGPVEAVGGPWYRVRPPTDAEPHWLPAPYLQAASDAAARESVLAGDWRAFRVDPGPVPLEPVRPWPAVPARDPRFGLVEAFRLDEPARAAALGAAYQRLVFWWSGMQASPGAALNPHYLPLRLLDRERARGLDLVGLLIHTPAWAASEPAQGPRAVPRNLDLPWDDPRNDWGRFVEQMARTYAGRIDDWIVWNEPDIEPADPNAAYQTWAGTVDDYYQLLRVAYRAVKKGNPAARVHLAGLTYWVDERKGRPQYFARLLDLVAADETAAANNHYFDVATLHLYTDPRTLYHVPRLYRDLMRARGVDKPIWIDETNVIPWDDPTNRGTGYDTASDMRCTLTDQASYVLQAFGLALAGGVERIALYKAIDSPGASGNGAVDAAERAALLREDGSLRPAYVAYQTAVRYFAGATGARYFPGPTVETVVLERPSAERTTVLWNATAGPVTARLTVAGARATLIDPAGRRHALGAAPDGAYAIVLPGASCNTDPDNPHRFLLGGETYLVVEDDVPADAPLLPATPVP